MPNNYVNSDLPPAGFGGSSTVCAGGRPVTSALAATFCGFVTFSLQLGSGLFYCFVVVWMQPKLQSGKPGFLAALA